MKFFFDNCIAPALSKAIASLAGSKGIEVVHLSERFVDRSIADVEWISTIREEGWIIISGDTRITRSPAERAAWHESGLTAFFLDDAWARRNFRVKPRSWCAGFQQSSKPSGHAYLEAATDFQ